MSYVGQKIPLPLGLEGLYGTEGEIPPGGLKKANGITLENRRLEKEGGAARQNVSTLPDRIVALYDWWPDTTTQRTLAVTRTGGVYRDEGAWTFPVTVLPEGTLRGTVSMPPQFVAGGQESPGNLRKLFLLTGLDAVYVGSGDFTTMTALAAAKTPADWQGPRQPSCGVIHEGRFWALLEHTGHYSTPTDHEDVKGGGILPIAPGDGQKIVAAYSFRRMLVIFKFPRGIFIVDTSDPTPGNWRYDAQSKAVGATSPHGVVAVPNDLVFVDAAGSLHVLSATAVDRDAASSDISTPKIGSWIRDNIDPEALDETQAVWYEDKHQVQILLPGRGLVERIVSAFTPGTFDPAAFQIGEAGAEGTGPTRWRVMVDFNDARLGPKFTYSDRDNATAIMARRLLGAERPYIGTDSGIIYRIDTPERAKEGRGYLAEGQTDDLDLGDIVQGWQDRPKNYDFLELWLEGVGNYTVSVDVYLDGVKTGWSPITFLMQGTGVPLGTFKLDVDKLAEKTVTRVVRRLYGRGVRIGFRVFNQNANETFKIARAYVWARLGG